MFKAKLKQNQPICDSAGMIPCGKVPDGDPWDLKPWEVTVQARLEVVGWYGLTDASIDSRWIFQPDTKNVWASQDLTPNGDVFEERRPTCQGARAKAAVSKAQSRPSSFNIFLSSWEHLSIFSQHRKIAQIQGMSHPQDLFYLFFFKYFFGGKTQTA